MGKISDIALISQVVLFNNKNAYGELVERYQDTVRRFLIHLCGDADLAYDLAQETFIKAYISIGSFQGLSNFQTWILRIAYNQFYDHIKVLKNQKLERYDLLYEGQFTADPAYIEDMRMDIKSACMQLRADERTAIVLFYLEELPIKQIAKIMRSPEGNVKSLLSRGRTKLSQILKQSDYEG